MSVNPVNLANSVTQVTVTSSPGTATTTAFGLTSAAIYVLIQNRGDTDLSLFFGGQSTISSTSGFLLKPGASIEFANVIPLGSVGTVFGATGTVARYTYLIALT
jgi:hypothetical protein